MRLLADCGQNQFYREARRRKVFRTAALYLLGSWVVLPVADGKRAG